MIKTYFKTARRNLLHNKVYSLINIFGLGISLTVCLLIFNYIHYEKSFDADVPNSDLVYRLIQNTHYQGVAPQDAAFASPKIPSLIQSEFSEVENATRLILAQTLYNNFFLEYKGNKITSDNIVCTDSTFTSFFPQKVIEGNSDFLPTRNSFVITESLARKIFGSDAALGKLITIRTADTAIVMQVDQVIADIKPTSHIQASAFIRIPVSLDRDSFDEHYQYMIGAIYFRLNRQIDIPSFNAKMTAAIHEKNRSIDLKLQPLKDIHGKSTQIAFDTLNYHKTDAKNISIFMLIAFVIFAIACANFINISIIINGYRWKEVGIKKVVGATRAQLFWQLILENYITTFIAGILAIAASFFTLPLLDKILEADLESSFLWQPQTIISLAVVLVVTAFITGIYPAWKIGNVSAEKALKTKVLFGKSSLSLRNIMVVGQFSIVIAMIIGLIVVFQQLSFITNQNVLGYNYEQVIKIPLNGELNKKLSVVENHISSIKGVNDVTSGHLDLGNGESMMGVSYISPEAGNGQMSATVETVPSNYLSFFNIKLLKGRGFSANDQNNNYLINEAMAEKIGWKDPIGQQIKISFLKDYGTVIGVIKNYNYGSLHEKVEPLIISASPALPGWQKFLYVKLKTTALPSTLASIEKTVNNIQGEKIFSYEFMDEMFARIYKSEMQLKSILIIFGVLAIIIACLGLFSLIMFATIKRTKEIGVRKVLGASVTGITTLLSKDFLKLILISLCIASPLAWLFMNQWLDNFAYRITINWWIFLFAGLLAMLIALITVSFQAIKAAMANPVKSLRSE